MISIIRCHGCYITKEANRAMEIAYKANDEAEKKNTEQGDLFSGKEGLCS